MTRRQFHRLLGAGTVAALAAGREAQGEPAAAQRGPAPAQPVRRGVWQTTHAPMAIAIPHSTPPGQTWRYLLPYTFQIAPRTAALMLSIKVSPGPGQDFPVGADLLPFEDWRRLDPARAIPLTRNHNEPNPNAGGKPAIMAKYPAQMGFVPFGALRPDGTPHPHAGTGFALADAAAWPVDDSEGVAHFPDRVGRAVFRGSRAYRMVEVHQLAFDGRELKATSMERSAKPDVAGGYELEGRGMGSAIPDGDDLLIAMSARRPGAAAFGSGVARWRRVAGKWKAVDFSFITPEDNSLEPSVVRDVDGSLLFFARGRRDAGPPVRVWRRVSEGEPWVQIIFRNGITNSTPVVLNRAADGTPFLLMNLFVPPFRLPPDVVSDGGISRMEPKGRRGERSTICLWALNDARDGFATPLIVRDPLVDFGEPPRGTVWAADHANGTPVRLEDGAWHCVYGHRILEWIENVLQTPPSSRTGCYIDEVISLGPPAPLWNFQDDTART